MRRIAFAALLAVLCALIAPVQPASACGVGGDNCVNRPDNDGGGVSYFYQSTTQTFYPIASNEDGTETEVSGRTWETRYITWCDARASETDPSGMTCADEMCEVGGEFGYMTMVFRRSFGGGLWELWPGRDRECRVTDEEPIALEEFEERIITTIEEHYSKIARPTITIAPPADAVVNLPVIASTADAGNVGFDITEPLPGRVEASPSYGWAWSNGQAGSGPGRPYDGTDPAAAPGHYPVHAVYARGGNGSVDLAATWSIVLTVDGIPPIEDIEPLVYDATASFAVRNATTIIVD